MRILLAVDGSKYSNEAVVQCGKLAKGLDTVNVKIVTALEDFIPTAMESYVTSNDFMPDVEAHLKEHYENLILDAESLLRSKDRIIDIETEILKGSAKRMIVEEAERWKADLIVIGSHGYGFWRRNFLGSTSDAVVHHASCSVLVAKEKR